MSDHKPLTKEDVRGIRMRKYIKDQGRGAEWWVPCGNLISAAPEAMPVGTDTREFHDYTKIDDVRSAYEGMKAYLHGRSQELMMKNPEMGMSFADAEIMLEEWFSVFKEDSDNKHYAHNTEEKNG